MIAAVRATTEAFGARKKTATLELNAGSAIHRPTSGNPTFEELTARVSAPVPKCYAVDRYRRVWRGVILAGISLNCLSTVLFEQHRQQVLAGHRMAADRLPILKGGTGGVQNRLHFRHAPLFVVAVVGCVSLLLQIDKRARNVLEGRWRLLSVALPTANSPRSERAQPFCEFQSSEPGGSPHRLDCGCLLFDGLWSCLGGPARHKRDEQGGEEGEGEPGEPVAPKLIERHRVVDGDRGEHRCEW
jgi:hypothetical protein